MRKSSIAMRLFGTPVRAAGLEDIDRLVGDALRHPAAHRPAAQPFVFEGAELLEVVEALDVVERIEVERLRPLQPERAAGVWVEVPVHDLANVGVEPLAGGGHGGGS